MREAGEQVGRLAHERKEAHGVGGSKGPLQVQHPLHRWGGLDFGPQDLQGVGCIESENSVERRAWREVGGAEGSAPSWERKA